MKVIKYLALAIILLLQQLTAIKRVKEEKKKIFRPFVIRRSHPEWKLSSKRKGRGGKNYKKLFLLNKPNG